MFVPTYRRPDDLARCLASLGDQVDRPDQVVVVVRASDTQTLGMLTKRAQSEQVVPIDVVVVDVEGLVKAVNEGLRRVTTDIVAITDDDAVPHPDWLSKITSVFRDHPEVGGVGGRDNVHLGDDLIVGERLTVGRIPQVGKVIGNHHLGAGRPRFVDMLKGVNGAYRTEIIRSIGLDPRLKGTGAQVHWEIGLGYQVRAAGWRLWYDPAILVEHFVATRHDEDQRDAFSAIAVSNAAYNLALLRMERLAFVNRIAHLGWCVAIGSRDAPGIAQALRLSVGGPKVAIKKMFAGLSGTLRAFYDVSKSPVHMP